MILPEQWASLRALLQFWEKKEAENDIAIYIERYAGPDDTISAALLREPLQCPQTHNWDSLDLISRVVSVNVDNMLSDPNPSSSSAHICQLYLEHSLSWHGAIFCYNSAWIVLARWSLATSTHVHLAKWLADRCVEQAGYFDEDKLWQALAVVSTCISSDQQYICISDTQGRAAAELFRSYASRVDY